MNSKKLRILMPILSAMLWPALSLQAQELPGMVDLQPRTTATPTSGQRFDHRFRFMFGAGFNKYQTGYLSETANSWMINSFIHSSAFDSNSSPVFNVRDPEKLSMVSYYWGGDYTFKDRWFLTLEDYIIKQEFTRDDPAQVDFILPANGNHRPSYFEGVRLVEYFEENRSIELKYLHPLFFKGFKMGPFVAREWYRERNDISYGSYVASSSTHPVTASTNSWSQFGQIPVEMHTAGWAFGPAMRYQLFDWLGFHYKLGIISREGDQKAAGFRTVQHEATSGNSAGLLFTNEYGKFKDTGTRHNLETIFRLYCRYNITLGILKEDISRKHSEYWGATPGNITLYQAKTPSGIGFAETMSAHKIDKLEFYLKIHTAFFW